MLLRSVELPHAHAQIRAHRVAKRQTAIVVEFFEKVFHSEPPVVPKGVASAKALPKGEVRRIVLF